MFPIVMPDPLSQGRPFAWVLPLLSALAGLCAAVAADPIARAWRAKREPCEP
jgi:hypothetical protein